MTHPKIRQYGGVGGQANAHRRSMLHVTTKLGLNGNLQQLLDAGYQSSWDSGVDSQRWRSVGLDANDFRLGATTSSAADDPTFNGTIGNLTNGEYFSIDGGDFFLYDAANATWINNLHKDNANFTLCGWFYRTNGTDGQGFFSTFQAFTNGPGVDLSKPGGGFSWLRLIVTNGTGVALDVTGPDTVQNAWHFIAVGVNEAGGANASYLQVNSSQTTFNGAYTSPSASDASHTAAIYASGGGAGASPSGGRIAAFAAWDVFIAPGAMLALFQASRWRFGV